MEIHLSPVLYDQVTLNLLQGVAQLLKSLHLCLAEPLASLLLRTAPARQDATWRPPSDLQRLMRAPHRQWRPKYRSRRGAWQHLLQEQSLRARTFLLFLF